MNQKKAKSPHRKPKSYLGILCFVRPDQKAALQQLSKQSRVPQQVYVREALDDFFVKYKDQLKDAPALRPKSKKPSDS